MSMKPSCRASYFAQKKSSFLARTWHTRAFLGFALFCFHNLHTRMLKRGIFQQEKRGKATFTEHPCLQTAANSQKRGKKPVKTSNISGKNSEKKRKTSELLPRKLRRLFSPFRWRLWKQKVQNCCDARAWRAHRWEAKTLHSNCDKQRTICKTIALREAIDRLAHHSTSGKSRTTHSRMLHKSSSAFSRSPTKE